MISSHVGGNGAWVSFFRRRSINHLNIEFSKPADNFYRSGLARRVRFS
jgi:hypothetical protein